MAKTDRQTDKTSRWSFTAYEGQWSLFETIPPGIAEWGWQIEICPKTNRDHYQGYLRTTAQQRASWLKKLIPGVHIEPAKNWDALKNYCKKPETRIEGTQVHQTSNFMTLYQYTDDVAKRIADVIKKDGGTHIDEIPMPHLLRYVDAVVREDIRSGKRYASDIAVNPQWISKWKRYGRELIFSFYNINNGDVSEPSIQESAEVCP